MHSLGNRYKYILISSGMLDNYGKDTYRLNTKASSREKIITSFKEVLCHNFG